MVYYDQEQIQILKQHFEQIAVDDNITKQEMEDVLVSLGLIVQKEELNALFDGQTEIDFQKYLMMLKESTVRNTRGIKGNFLKDRTLHFEPVLQSKNK